MSPSGRWLVIADEGGSARIWDLHADAPAATPTKLGGHGKSVTDFAFCPPSDHWLVIGGDEGSARLWDLRRLAPAVNSIALGGHEGRIEAVDFSPDGHWVLTRSGKDMRIRLWDMQPRTRPRSLLTSAHSRSRRHFGAIDSLPTAAG